MAKFDIYEAVTNRIIDQLEQGVIPWRKPWTGIKGGAYSRSTGRAYSLLNQMILGRPGEYLTFNQVKEAGGTVRKGEKASMVVFWKQLPVTDTIDSEDAVTTVTKVIPFLRYYNVFHIDQCEGVEPKYKAEDVKPFDPIEEAEAVCADYISRSGVKLTVKASNEAYYDRLIDGVVVPCREQYDKPAEFYSTLFHELVHSTGHKSRLNRFTGSAVLAGFGSEDYSKEELVAEIGSAAILNRLGIETESSFTNSAAYIASWLKALKNDRRLIVSAAGKADKAVELICPTADSKPEQAQEQNNAAQEVAPAATPEQQPEQQHKQETTAVKPMKGFKRAEFYSLHRDFKTGVPRLEQHKGYTDGVFFYYRTGKGGGVALHRPGLRAVHCQ